MIILVTGSRTWTDRRCIIQRLMQEPDGTVIIQGEANGADYIAKHAALALGFRVISDPAAWDKCGRSAGPIRNARMLNRQPDLVLAFRKNNSPGTTNTINAARARGIPVELVEA